MDECHGMIPFDGETIRMQRALIIAKAAALSAFASALALDSSSALLLGI